MSYPYGAPAPTTRPQRPATVLISTLLLVVVAACAVVYTVALAASAGAYREAAETTFAGRPNEESLVDGLAIVGVMVVVVTGGIYLLFGLVLVVLGIFNNLGKNGSRIATWVVGGLGACCGALGVVNAALGSASGTLTGDDVSTTEAEEFERALDAQLPAWLEPTTLAAAGIGEVALLVALVLLMLPPSNAFFRKPAQPQLTPPPQVAPPAGPPPPPGYPPPGYPPQSFPPAQGFPPPQGYPPPPHGYQPPGHPPQPPPPPPPPPPPMAYPGGESVHDQPTRLEGPPGPGGDPPPGPERDGDR